MRMNSFGEICKRKTISLQWINWSCFGNKFGQITVELEKNSIYLAQRCIYTGIHVKVGKKKMQKIWNEISYTKY